jgi:hypothetical protein
VYCIYWKDWDCARWPQSRRCAAASAKRLKSACDYLNGDAARASAAVFGSQQAIFAVLDTIDGFVESPAAAQGTTRVESLVFEASLFPTSSCVASASRGSRRPLAR